MQNITNWRENNAFSQFKNKISSVVCRRDPFIILHIEGHITNLALEAGLVPDLLQAFQLLHRVNRLLKHTSTVCNKTNATLKIKNLEDKLT